MRGMKTVLQHEEPRSVYKGRRRRGRKRRGRRGRDERREEW